MEKRWNYRSVFSLTKISKKTKNLSPQVSLYTGLNDEKRKTSIRGSKFELRALFDFAESRRLLKTKRRKSNRIRKSPSKKSDSF